MKVFDRIKESRYPDKEELKRIVCDLIPLRGNEFKTGEYYDMYLHADDRYSIWKDEREDCILNDCLDLNPQYYAFIHNKGEIHKDCVSVLRNELLNVLEADKYSFAYIYNLLAQKSNRQNKLAVHDCIFDSDSIDYAINFDMNELQEKLDNCPDLKEKWRLCNESILNSSKHPYNGELKDKYTSFCNQVADSIKTEISIFGYSAHIANGLPKELETKEAKSILQKLIKTGLCDDNYNWKGSIQLLAYFADKASHYLQLSNKQDGDGNYHVSWKPFEELFNYNGKCSGKNKLKDAKQSFLKTETEFKPTDFHQIDIIFQ